MKKKQNKAKAVLNKSVDAAKKIDLGETLHSIASKRTGGAINLRGVEFQLYFASLLTLKTLLDDSSSIRLEGIEDIDLFVGNSNEFIQAKTSQNRIDANTFWNSGVLQNFIPVHQADPTF